MHQVDAEVAGAHNASERIHVGAVAVDEPTAAVNQPNDLFDVFLEKAERIRIGDHEPSHLIGAGRSQCLDIDIAALVGGNLNGNEACHCRRCRVGAVRRIGNEDLVALLLTARGMIGADHQQRRELAMRARRRLERDAGKSANLGKPSLHAMHQRQVALDVRGRRQRVRLGEAGQSRHLLADLRVVLHGARAERIEAAIHPEVALREAQIVTHHVQLRQLRQTIVCTREAFRQRRLGNIQRRQCQSAARDPPH